MEGYVDLALTKDEAEERNTIAPLEAPKYPYGTTLSLDEKILEKMEVDHSDWKVGDIFHIHALAKVTGIHENETQEGEKCCVNLQLIAIKGESEDAEDEEDEHGEPSLEKHGYHRY